MTTSAEAAAIADRVREFIVHNFLFGTDAPPLDESFLESGVVDSTGILEIIAFLERTYAIKVADEELIPENIDSIANIAAFVISKRHL